MGMAVPRAVMFDMTGTLHPQSHIAIAATAATQVVLGRHDHLSLEECMPVIGRAVRESFASHAVSGFYLMRDALATGHRAAWPRLGVELDEALLTAALDTFETTLVGVIEPYPSAIEVLSSIRARGIATAIVSVNDEQLLQDCVDACGLRPYFDLVLSSETARSCKPEPGMFEQTMAALGVSAAESVFVGDMPELDIAGARRLGIRAVLTTEDATFIGSFADVGDDGIPDVTISTLAALPAALGLI